MNELTAYKACSFHPSIRAKLRTSKDGKQFYSHALLYKGQLVWCSGWGYKNPDKNGSRYLPEPDEINYKTGEPFEKVEQIDVNFDN